MKKIISLILILFIVTGVNIETSFFAWGQTSAELINREIKELNEDIDGQRDKIKNIQKKQEEYSEAIKKAQSEKSSLNNQLAIMDNRLAKAQLDIEIVEERISRSELEIKKTDLEISNQNKELEKEKSHISNVFKLIQKKDQVTALEILLLNNSLADFLSQVRYLEDINESIGESIDNLEKIKRNLEKEKKELDEKNVQLASLKKELLENRNKLAAEKENKTYLLDQVNRSEGEFQKLLSQAKKEQEDASAEIASMEKLVRAKLAKLEGDELSFNDSGMIWPVPKNTITAYFHDPDYPFRNIFEHPAIDIRAGQETPLKAAASGYVARAKYGSGGSYGYIMLIHGDGVSTVYGHASKIFVAEDEYVTQGQIIGLSGGLPGTPGAGRLTTGPHLHFEVRLNGIPVDPLSYLP